MKKILLILFVTAFATFVFAQDPAEQKFHFGLKVAPALAWFKTDSKNLSSNGSAFGFSYGLITEFNLTKNYSFATGLDVTYRGGKFKSSIITYGKDTITTNKEATNTLQYIEIPLTLKLKTNEIGSFTYFLQFGVAPGYNIRAREEAKIVTQVHGVNTPPLETDDVDIQDHINAFNLSMVITGGLEYSLSGNTVFLGGITFNNGFLDIIDGSDLKANSNYLALTLGILF